MANGACPYHDLGMTGCICRSIVSENEGAAKKERTDGERLAAIYGIATRALSEPPDTEALVEICTMIEERAK